MTTVDTMPALYKVGDLVRTPYVKGKILEVIDAAGRGWSERYYYLIQPRVKRATVRPHTFRESEVCILHGGS